MSMSEKKNENQGKKTFKISDYKSGDVHAICALFEKVFGKPMGKTESIRHWQWEFLENPLKEIFIKLAWDKENLVGQYAASPVRIYADGSDIIAALSHDTMTDPQYSGQGIFTNTAENLYAAQEKAGHGFIYGFPNRNSIHGFEKNLNWRKIMPAPVHIRPVRITKNISDRIFKGERLSHGREDVFCIASTLLSDKSKRYELRHETKFGDWADELWQRCREQHRLWVVRDKSYLNWRYIKKPENKYNVVSVWHANHPVGYVVMVCAAMNFGNTVFVMDFMVDLNFKDAAGLLIRYVIKAAQENKCPFASVLLSPGSKYRWLFRKNLFLPLPERLFPQPLYFGGRCFDPSMNKLVNDPKAWSISWGDNDVI